MVSLDVENESQKKQILELEKFVMLLSSALTDSAKSSLTSGNNETNLIKQFASQFNMDKSKPQKKDNSNKEETLQEKITLSLGRLDLLMKENFELRRELIFERKKFIDLQHSFKDL